MARSKLTRLVTSAAIAISATVWGAEPVHAATLSAVNQAASAESSWAWVELASALHVGRSSSGKVVPGAGASFELAADGAEFVAAELRAARPAPTGDRPALFAVTSGTQIDTTATHDVLPAGTYRLLLMTDGRNPRMTLRIAARDGEQVVPMNGPLEVLTRTSEGAGEPPTAPSAMAGHSLELTRPGLLYARVQLSNAAGPARAEVCEYDTEGAPGAYGVDCPGGRSRSVIVSPEPLSPETCCLRLTMFDVGAGRYGFGGNVTAASATRARAYTVVIPYPQGEPPVVLPVIEPPPVIGPPPVLGWVRVNARGRAIGRRRVAVRVACVDERACSGSVGLAGVRRRYRFRLEPRRALWVRVRLSARQRRLLQSRRWIRFRVAVRGVDSRGQSRKAVGVVRVTVGRRGLRRRPNRPEAPGATPLWTGDTFEIDRGGVHHGGDGALPPYQWSSASGPRGGWFQPHSNTDPNVHGVTVAKDPAGIARRVIRVHADERRHNGSYVRMEVRGKAQFGPGMDRWVIHEVYLPRDTPTMTASGWWTFHSIYGEPYDGAGPNSFQLRRNASGTGNDLRWLTPGGATLWSRPATTGVWHILARRIRFSTDASNGFSEIWYSQRDALGNPSGPLTRQRLEDGTQRRHYKMLDPSINWDGRSLNHGDVKVYHSARMWPDRRFTTLYFARFRVYDGQLPIGSLDPYFTGLR